MKRKGNEVSHGIDVDEARLAAQTRVATQAAADIEASRLATEEGIAGERARLVQGIADIRDRRMEEGSSPLPLVDGFEAGVLSAIDDIASRGKVGPPTDTPVQHP